jgi:hypothetical protein
VALPLPVPGLVIRYSYLWHSEHRKGLEDGVKDRPCAIILVTERRDGAELVTVAPVTHSPPTELVCAIEIPAETKRRLRLDGEQSWAVLSEVNRFTWPGPDLRPISPGQAGGIAYGLLPRAFFFKLRDRFLDIAKAQRLSVVPRTE